ncbi:MAG: hypothetical protein ACOX88_00025 [Christensenellales bacterium]|jgi:hypothetical protein
MENFWDWNLLATYAGATLATNLITEVLKDLKFFAKLPTRLLSYVIAVIILLAANIFTGQFTLANGVLCIINGLLVSLTSNGTFDAVASTFKKKLTSKTDETDTE